MKKKTYSLEFTYSKENDSEVKVYALDSIDIKNKDALVQETCNNLIYKQKAFNLVVREICTYKVL
ncbi:hypothetical protein FC831_13835 [Clostridium botulinum]|nr:hypothetical protein [Clostridium botulinum]